MHLFGPSAGAALDLADRTLWRKVEGADQPNYTRQFSSSGSCGACTVTVLKESKLNYVGLPYTIYCTGVNQQVASQNRNAFLSMCEDARAYSLKKVGSPVYIVRSSGDQSPADVWTVKDYEVSRTNKAWESIDGAPIYTLEVLLLAVPGQELPDGLCS